MKESLLGLSLVLLFSCSDGQNENDQIESHDQKIAGHSAITELYSKATRGIEYRLFRTDTVLQDQVIGWGYDIYVDQKRMMR